MKTKLNRLTDLFFWVTLFFLPLYFIRFDVLNFSVSIIDILAITTIAFWFAANPFSSLIHYIKENKLFFFSFFLILAGLFSSFLSNKPHGGFGIILTWFVLPFVFSLILIAKKDAFFIKKTLNFIYFSIFVASFVSLAYKCLGYVTYDNRLSSFYGSPNYLAMYISAGIFIGLYLLNFYKQKYFLFLFWLFSFFIVCLSLFFTFSYAAWISVFASLFIVFILTKKSRIWAVFLLVFSSLVFALQMQTIKMHDLINISERSSFVSRLMIWKSALKMLSDNLFFGIGAGNFQQTYLSYQKYFPLYLEWAVPHPHNLLLAFWLQTGIIGLIGFLILLSNLFLILVRQLKNKKNASLAALFLSYFLYVLIHGLVDTTFWKNDLAYIFWVFCMLSIATVKQNETDYNSTL